MMGHNVIKLPINSKDDNLKLLVYKISTIFLKSSTNFFVGILIVLLIYSYSIVDWFLILEKTYRTFTLAVSMRFTTKNKCNLLLHTNTMVQNCSVQLIQLCFKVHYLVLTANIDSKHCKKAKY